MAEKNLLTIKRATSKGQVSSLDLVMGVVVFIMLLALLNSFWLSATSNAAGQIVRSRYVAEGMSALDYAITSPGEPYYWNSSTANATAGFALRQGALSRAKLGNFSALAYASAKSSLGLQQDFYLLVQNATSNATLYSAGFDNVSQSNISYSFTRYSIIDGTPVRLRLRIYE